MKLPPQKVQERVQNDPETSRAGVLVPCAIIPDERRDILANKDDLSTGSQASCVTSAENRGMAPLCATPMRRQLGNRWRAASITNGLAKARWPLVRLELPPEEEPK